jgi:hypothetical protein
VGDNFFFGVRAGGNCNICYIFFFLISKIYRKGAKGRNPKYTGCIQGTPKEQGKENNCLTYRLWFQYITYYAVPTLLFMSYPLTHILLKYN